MKLHMLCSYISQIFRRYISVIIRIGQGIKLSLIKNKYAISVAVTYGYLTDCFIHTYLNNYEKDNINNFITFAYHVAHSLR